MSFFASLEHVVLSYNLTAFIRDFDPHVQGDTTRTCFYDVADIRNDKSYVKTHVQICNGRNRSHRCCHKRMQNNRRSSPLVTLEIHKPIHHSSTFKRDDIHAHEVDTSELGRVLDQPGASASPLASTGPCAGTFHDPCPTNVPTWVKRPSVCSRFKARYSLGGFRYFFDFFELLLTTPCALKK